MTSPFDATYSICVESGSPPALPACLVLTDGNSSGERPGDVSRVTDGSTVDPTTLASPSQTATPAHKGSHIARGHSVASRKRRYSGILRDRPMQVR
ncbi:hypothetical protein V494_08116 [Pseudogymnoascus sp. VKM F-4513 (FW-928)]|nr:hypothetical protein V494_08116 [Pseudogymnoascus sp. VKM F-4513 (FW-928)]